VARDERFRVRLVAIGASRLIAPFGAYLARRD
jgi:hypothetical protein